MSYYARIAFKAMPPDGIYPFFKKIKKAALESLTAIAKAEYPYCPMCRDGAITRETDFTAFKRENPVLVTKSEAWFQRLFTYRWFYDPEWQLLGVYGLPDAIGNSELFDAVIDFQNSTDQDYPREAWAGIAPFLEIFDACMAEPLAEDKGEPDEGYNRRTNAYDKIWTRIAPTLYDNDDAVHMSLFDGRTGITHQASFLHACFDAEAKSA